MDSSNRWEQAFNDLAGKVSATPEQAAWLAILRIWCDQRKDDAIVKARQAWGGLEAQDGCFKVPKP